MLRAFRFEKIPRVDISIFSLTLGSQTLSNELGGKNRAVAAYVASCDGSNEKGEFLSTFWLLAPGRKISQWMNERERDIIHHLRSVLDRQTKHLALCSCQSPRATLAPFDSNRNEIIVGVEP